MLFKYINYKAISSFNRFLFSSNIRKGRLRTANNVHKRQQTKIEDPVNQDYDHFDDCFKTIENLHKSLTSNIQLQKIKQSKQLYEQIDEESTRMLRSQTQNLIVKISQGQLCYQQLQKLLNLIISMHFRFRRWDDMVLNINNVIQAYKYEKGENSDTAKLVVWNYHKLCAIYIMNDHEQLYELMDFQVKLTAERRRKIPKKQKRETFGLGFEDYHKLELNYLDSSFVSNEANQIVLMQAKGLLVLGLKSKALRKLAILAGKQINKEMREQAFLAILLSLNFKAKDSQPLSQKQFDNIKKVNYLTLYDAEELAKSYITVDQCQTIVSALLQHFHKKSIANINAKILSKYWSILALICQNYIIDERQSDYLRLTSLLKSKNHEQLNFMLMYFELARYIDKNDLQHAQLMFTKIKIADQQIKNGMRPFYRSDLAIFDQLRVNILKMGCGIYEMKGDKESSEQYMDESSLLECKLGVYTIREPSEQITDEQSNLTVDWRKTVSGRVPYYYLNLKLQKIFVVQENIFGEQQF